MSFGFPIFGSTGNPRFSEAGAGLLFSQKSYNTGFAACYCYENPANFSVFNNPLTFLEGLSGFMKISKTLKPPGKVKGD